MEKQFKRLKSDRKRREAQVEKQLGDQEYKTQEVRKAGGVLESGRPESPLPESIQPEHTYTGVVV